MGGIIPNEDAFRRIGDATRFYEGSYRNRGLKGEKRKIIGGGCKARNEIWRLTITGSPTGGTFDVDINVFGTTETMTFNFDDTLSEVQTELETHTNIASGDVSVSGGPFPDADMNIEFTGDLARYRMEAPLIDFSGLTGSAGMSVLLSRYQPGHPKDGSVAQ